MTLWYFITLFIGAIGFLVGLLRGHYRANCDVLRAIRSVGRANIGDVRIVGYIEKRADQWERE